MKKTPRKEIPENSILSAQERKEWNTWLYGLLDGPSGLGWRGGLGLGRFLLL
jgi:hypothetical protein